MVFAGLSVALLLAVGPVQPESNVVERFVAVVQAGTGFDKSEFAGLVKPDDAAELARVAKCKPGAPRASESGAVLVMWDCSAQDGPASLGTMLDVRNGKITSVFVMPAVVVPARSQ